MISSSNFLFNCTMATDWAFLTSPCSVAAQQDWERAMRNSATVYVGNLSFFTREEQVYEVFSKVGTS